MLGGVKGVVAPAVFGGKDRTILIYVDPHKLEARNLSPLDVVEALRRSNLMVTPGVAKFGSYEFQLDSNAMVAAVDELNDIPIRMEPGNNVYLRDVGHAEDSSAIQTALVRINGKRQVYVPIYRQQGASSLTVIDGVKKDIPHMTDVLKSNDKDVKLTVVMDQTVSVREAIKALVHEGVIGAVLVSVMILIFLGNFRMTLIASMSIPLAILSAIIGLYATGNTINAMTLGGLALAIGPLVDDAIVVLENTHRHHTLGKSRYKAAFDGAVEVTIPVLVATATTIIVLCPVALMPGMGGFLFRPLFWAVFFAMAASFVLSRTFVPVLCARWLGGHAHAGQEHAGRGLGGRIHHKIELGLTWLTRRYERLLAFALRHRLAVLVMVALLFVGSLGLLFGIGREFFPQIDAGQISVFVRCPSGSNIEATEERVAKVEKFIEEQIPARERKMVISELGLVPDWSAAYSPNSGSQDAVIKVQLTDERTLSSQEYAVKLRHAFEQARQDPQFPDVRVNFDTGGMVSAALNYGASSPIDIQIENGTFRQARDLARKVHDQAAGVRGAADVRVQQRLDAPQRVIEIDRKMAADLGLSEDDVIKQVAAAMNSSVSINRNFWIDPKSGNQYFVAIQYAENPDLKLEDVLNVPVTGPRQPKESPVKLSSLVTIKPGSAPVEVNHVSLARVFNVLVNTENRDIGGVARDINKRLKRIQKESWEEVRKEGGTVPNNLDDESDGLMFPHGMRVKLKGEYARMMESFGSLGFGLIMASVLVYLLLVALFRSWLGPFIIMFTVPLGLIGVLAMLFLTHTTLNVQSSMGIIFLVGIVVSNGVLLVDFANKQRKLGAPLHAAITMAAAIRFRPILMTFFATFLDLLPMAIGLGRGSEANVPLARAVVVGLLTSTFLTLIVVPVLYTLLNREQREPEVDLDKELADVPVDMTPRHAGHAPAPAAEPVTLIVAPHDNGEGEFTPHGPAP
jgi:multidrug efflux pump subunit AcrB